MIIAGSKGFASELLEILSTEKGLCYEDIFLFDNIGGGSKLTFGHFKLLHSFEEAGDHFRNIDRNFTLGLGNPAARKKLTKQLREVGGELQSVISDKASIGSFGTKIGKGCQIMQGVIITNNVKIGEGVLVNLNATISHDVTIGDFCEIACGVNIAGRCIIEENVFIGTNATINPDVVIGKNAIIGSGAVVLKDVPPNSTLVGNPAKIIKRYE